MHQWDVILKRGFSSLLWFPSWLHGMRALVSFHRLSTMVSQLCKHLKEDVQLPVTAEMIEQVRVPSIAEWREGSLHTAVDALAGVLPTLSTHFDAKLFKNVRDPVTITRCKSALHSTAWAWQFQFVLSWICGIQRWGRGCACHSNETECKWKGGRLPVAAVFDDRELSRGLQEAESWTKDTFQTTVSEHLDLVRCVRTSYHMAGKKFAYLQKLPWLIVRIFEPGVKKECLRQCSSKLRTATSTTGTRGIV